MNPKKYLENWIQGWLPKKPTLPSHQRISATRAKNQKSASIRRMKWLAISLYVALLLFTWLDYFIKLTGYTTLESALLYTLIAPVLTFAGFKIHQIKSLKFWQILWAIFGAAAFGFAIFAVITFLLNRVFSLPTWAETPSAFLTFSVSYVIGTYLGYRFGKRRGFRPPLYV